MVSRAGRIDANSVGTCITIDVFEEAINDIIEVGMTRLLVERSEDGGISFDEVTEPSERPVLEVDKLDYRFIDRTGDASYIYRTRFIATEGPLEGKVSEPGEEIAGIGLAIRGILTVPQLKERYMFGVDLTDDTGEELSDQVFQHYILKSIRWMEKQLDIPILPTSFVEKHDYYRGDYHNYNFIRLDNYPVLSVVEFRVQYPSGQNVIVFPNEWLRVNFPEGHLQVVPTAGTLSEILIGEGGSFLPAIYNGLDYLPGLYEISYSAGFADNQVPEDILDLIGMFAAIGPFHIFGDLIAGAGIATVSLSMDGLSQNIGTTSSATNSGYGARVGNYLKEIKEQVPHLRKYYKGIRMVVA